MLHDAKILTFLKKLNYYLEVFDQGFYNKQVASRRAPTEEFYKDNINREMMEVLLELRKTDLGLSEVDWKDPRNQDLIRKKPFSRDMIDYYLKFTTIDTYFKYFTEYTYRTSFDMLNLPLNLKRQLEQDRMTEAPSVELAKELDKVLDMASAALDDDFVGQKCSDPVKDAQFLAAFTARINQNI